MKHRRVIIYLCVCLAFAWVLFYIRMQNIVKEPVEDMYNQGETFKYYGLEITPGDLEVYDYIDFKKKYGKPDDNCSDEVHDRYIIVNIHVKNKSGKDINIKDGISTWMMSIDNFSNGQSDELMGLNNVSPYEKDAEVDLKLFFRFVDGTTYQGDVDKIKKSPIRIYMSYYPELRFIEYN